MQNRSIDTERMLLHLIATGDQKSFTMLFEHYSKTVYPFALKLTRSEELAEEILQEIFLKIWINRQNLPEIENFGAYVNRMTRNYAYNVLRRIAHENLIAFELSKQMTEEVNDTEDAVIYRDLEHSLNQAISCLTPQQKLIYTLCHQEGLKYSEVAGRLNISSSTVHTHMKLALKFIRTYFVQINTLILFYLLFK
ncbi:RNA polymerase sigma-70 factor (ECF subfamily) [Mucilaginibacter lappiensis]|uniref:RNA polymerase sigma-70 factor (ECF subfamily) n=1 Tax=Mucilaginibacter lappiensis TaxID=354630 RepID=A0ABR6PFE8_9SPHI|nr:RNA polymerase sigma-70 factor [Mucilaginibacter lappiensis]MBB6108328.1 RNA polymerase sigma-70 factor (ECF subfamily) [Mucilaginibacter lappiensis]